MTLYLRDPGTAAIRESPKNPGVTVRPDAGMPIANRRENRVDLIVFERIVG
jgi:hypothetical protein